MTDATQPSSETHNVRSDRSLIRRLRAGSDDAATQLYLRYAERLMQLSRQQVGKDLAPRLDADDIVQSVFRTFFRRVRSGNYDVPDGEELWKLFLVIGLNKIRSAATFHRAAKRNVGVTSAGDESLAQSAGGSSEESLQLLKMTIDEVLSQQPEAVRQMIQLRIEGYEVAEIATRSGRSKRSVERILQGFKEQLQQMLKEEV
ncbi:MAG: sigma-70 family RNA polymerase sigma factor [Planctomycetaceae bacterium]|nr:sigma-70 family RNA polymerase sigma factor [Planctomycetaceae bacterium]